MCYAGRHHSHRVSEQPVTTGKLTTNSMSHCYFHSAFIGEDGRCFLPRYCKDIKPPFHYTQRLFLASTLMLLSHQNAVLCVLACFFFGQTLVQNAGSYCHFDCMEFIPPNIRATCPVSQVSMTFTEDWCRPLFPALCCIVRCQSQRGGQTKSQTNQWVEGGDETGKT